MTVRIDLADLPPEARAEARLWQGQFQRIAARGHGVVRGLKRLARRRGAAFGTVRGKYYSWKSKGLIGALDRRRLGSRYWTNARRPMEFSPRERGLILLYRGRHPESLSRAMHALRKDLEAGKVRVGRPCNPRTGLPMGFSIANLRLAAKMIVVFKGRHQGRAFEVTAAGTLKLSWPMAKILPAASHPSPAQKTRAGAKGSSGMPALRTRSAATNRGLGE